MPATPAPKALAGGAAIVALIGAATLALTTGTTTPTLTRPPLTPIVNAPLVPQANRDVASATGLTLLQGGLYDPNMTRLPGTGSIRLPGQFAGVLSAPVPVRKGQQLTLSAMIRSDTQTSGQLTMYAANVNSLGQWSPINGSYLMQSTLAFQATGLPNQWQEASDVITAENDGYISIFLQRTEPQFAGSGTMWVDDFAVYDGVGVQAIDPGPRRAFDGSLVKVAADGRFSVRDAAGIFRPFFPACVALNGGSRDDAGRARVAAGFNCNIWAYPSPQNLGPISDAKKAGMMACMQVAQYIGRGDFAGQWAHLEQTINAINASPLSSSVLCYWFDNEQYDTLANFRALVATIRRADGGRRPIVMLQSHTYSRAFTAADGTPLYDVMGSYYRGGQARTNRSIWYGAPSTMCEIQVPQNTYRAEMQRCLDEGGTMSSVFADGTGASFSDPNNPPPVDSWQGWSGYASVKAELAALDQAPPASTVPPPVPTTPPVTTTPTTVAPVTTVATTVPSTTIAPTTTATVAPGPAPTTTVIYFPVRCIGTPTGLTCRS